MKHENVKYIAVFFLLSCTFNLSAQDSTQVDSTNHKRVNNIIPRFGIGVSKHFLSEFGIAYMRSHFINDKDLGLNVNNAIYYISFETMAPYTKPIIYGYKIGAELISIGHVTSAFGIEAGYFQKDVVSSFVIIPKLGIPLLNGSLSYGLGLYFNQDMRKEIGKHRIALTYCFNRKSDKAFNSWLVKHEKRKR